MNRFATIERAIAFKKATYYTVRMEGDGETLFLNFINSHSSEEFMEEMAIIRAWIRKLGEEVGVREQYLRYEAYRGGDARAFPPPARYIDVDCSLRLYCMRVNDHVAFLFSGARKTAETAQECDNVRPHFLLANKISKAIYQAIKDGDIHIDEQANELYFDPDLILEV